RVDRRQHRDRRLLRFIADIVGTAPRLADHLARRPAMFEGLTDPAFLKRTLGADELRKGLEQACQLEEGFEGQLNACRHWAHDEQFRTGLELLQGALTGAQAGTSFTAIADAVIERLFEVCKVETEAAHGVLPDGAWVVLGLGKLGAREMTATSDLDLIFVYDFVEGALQSDGPRPLAPGPYFARASQKLITALTALTSEGGLYEVDMRLRPSGNKGPVAVSLQTFTSYQTDEAWTWERMALTRARVVAGPAGLRQKVEAAMQTALAHPRPRETILSDVAGMRARLQREHAKSGPWDLKQHPGGMVDIEFIAQGLSLCAAQSAPQHFRVDGNTRKALQLLRDRGELSDDDANALSQGAELLDNLTHIVRLTVDGPFQPKEAPPGLKSLLCRVAGTQSWEETETVLGATMQDIRARFERLIGPVS
ncbi:MAG TPA: bifunctional glutamine-synthetase adenylyltransferase/deadenyltransferase, partial [Alphaproteobacteria bacterium]|nr:bifunctional glutamine-synthetase adenylyltransferase/deadenyltransferase [Alphaproteobacteria bacterium]